MEAVDPMVDKFPRPNRNVTLPDVVQTYVAVTFPTPVGLFTFVGVPTAVPETIVTTAPPGPDTARISTERA
jgi:hypothetical protein